MKRLARKKVELTSQIITAPKDASVVSLGHLVPIPGGTTVSGQKAYKVEWARMGCGRPSENHNRSKSPSLTGLKGIIDRVVAIGKHHKSA